MDHLFPSPPSSPIQHNQQVVDKVICGSCDKVLSSDWFCSDCHKRCETCNRFLSADEHCTRCWSFDIRHNTFVRKPRSTPHFYHQYHNNSFTLHSFQPPPSPPTPNQHVLSNPTMNFHHHAVTTSTMASLPHSFY
ncbi:hypothetical protein BDA99DRAFT_559740 [Phascolomyces articulosus]|uniref:Uncharacterized protein n=1 Tax=Phascolomyces articulosus TaxID=60185 RepID=A0AAD5KA92_9FUNG|nr:hypothetical protein BDA99DRAFT_559740 [Phascolomyces articulosus]